LDYCGGLADLSNRKSFVLSAIPLRRVQEDPLRIIRAERFSELLSFTIEEKSQGGNRQISLSLGET
jgi:tRNA nucleotidyltransferase/poly(A) polymerase